MTQTVLVNTATFHDKKNVCIGLYDMLQVSTPKGQCQAEKCSIFIKENIFCNKIQKCWPELYSLLSLWDTVSALSKNFLST